MSISPALRKKIKKTYEDLAKLEDKCRENQQEEILEVQNKFRDDLVDELAAELVADFHYDDLDFKPGKTDLLILTVGTSLPPLLISLAIHQPRFLALVYSSEVKDTIHQIETFITHKSWNISTRHPLDKADLKLKINSSKSDEVFEEMQKRWNNQWSKLETVGEGQVALDISGGKKTMTVGATQFAAVIPNPSSEIAGPFPLYYVDFEEYDDYLNRPNLATIKYCRIKDSIDVYILQKERRQILAFPEEPELTRTDKDRLVELLLKCGEVQNRQSWDEILGRLRETVNTYFESGFDRHIDVYRIVDKCAGHVGGVAKLLNSVHYFEIDGSKAWGAIEKWAKENNIHWEH